MGILRVCWECVKGVLGEYNGRVIYFMSVWCVLGAY